jgi:hypothetical protein
MNTLKTSITTSCIGLSLTLACAFPVSIEAKTLYVNGGTGNDSFSYDANSESTPWQTIGRAAWGSTSPTSPNAGQAARAGDTVLVEAGTYTTPSPQTTCSRWSVALNPANSGTSGSPITFRAVGTVTVLLAAGYYGPTIGADGRNYIVWDGFTMNEALASGASCADTGPVVFHVTTGSQALNLSITGTYRGWGDNYNGIRLESTRDIVIRNTAISAITGNCGSNCAGIMMYDNENTLIEHVDISTTVTGIYVKGDHGGDGWPQINTTIRLSRIHDITGCGIGLGAANTAKVYQNIIKASRYCAIRMYDFSSPQSSNITIQNNVIVAPNGTDNGGIVYAGTTNVSNMRVFNNIFYGPWSEAVSFGGNALGAVSYEHNVYYGYAAWGSVAGAQRSFATWKDTYSQDTASPAGITSNPSFANETDYKLNGGSPALSLGIDILDLDRDGSTSDSVPAGAYISGSEVIGLTQGTTQGSTDTSPPGIPMNVRIQ